MRWAGLPRGQWKGLTKEPETDSLSREYKNVHPRMVLSVRRPAGQDATTLTTIP